MSEGDHIDRVRTQLLDEGSLRGLNGTWQIFGEDPNCDFGGPHHEPLIATVQGTYESAVEYALGLPNFFTWGGGGKVRKVEVVKVDGATIRQRAVLRGRRTTLMDQLAEVEAELKKLGG